MDPKSIRDAVEFIQLWGRITIIVSLVFGGIGFGVYYWMHSNLIFGKAWFLRIFLTGMVAVIIPAAFSILIVEQYAPLADALDIYNMKRQPLLDVAGKLLFMIFDASRNETNIGKFLLGVASGGIGMAAYCFIGSAAWLAFHIRKKVRGGKR